MNEIENQMKSLKMPSMAQCWTSLVETRRHTELSLEDGLQLLLQAERDGRIANRNARLVKNAHFRYQASIESSVFDAGRGMDKLKVMSLASCEYIKQGVPVIITGPAGTGKSWIASALGYQACICGYKTRYFGMQKFYEELSLRRIEGKLLRFYEHLSSIDLLILDDFGMQVLTTQQVLDLMEIIEDRHGRKATIIASQLPVSEWYSILEANTTAADAILDRIVHTAQRFELKGASLRKK